MICKKILILIMGLLYIFSFSQKSSLNVLDYGAKSDDSQDDTAAFQKCVDALAKNNGGTMVIPRGIYHISHLKFFGKKYSNIRIDGNGSKIIQIFPKNRVSVHGGLWQTFAERYAADGCFVFDAKASNQKNDALSIKNININNLHFVSDVKKLGFDELSHQISAHGVSNFLVEHCSFTGFLGDGIAINAGTDISINSYAYNKNIYIKNCNFDGVNKDNRQGISIYYADGFLIEKCNFKNITRDDMPGAIDIEPDQDFLVSRNGLISECTFDNIGGIAAIVVHTKKPTKENDFSNKNFMIKNCKFNNTRAAFGIIGNDDFLNLEKNVYGVIIKDCFVTNTKTIAEIRKGYNILFQNIIFKNIDNEGMNTVTDGGAANITFEQCDFNTISNPNGIGFYGITRNINFIACKFKNFKANAITINDSEGVGNISNNIFISSAYPQAYPVVTSTYSRKVLRANLKNNKSLNNFRTASINSFYKRK